MSLENVTRRWNKLKTDKVLPSGKYNRKIKMSAFGMNMRNLNVQMKITKKYDVYLTISGGLASSIQITMVFSCKHKKKRVISTNFIRNAYIFFITSCYAFIQSFPIWLENQLAVFVVVQYSSIFVYYTFIILQENIIVLLIRHSLYHLQYDSNYIHKQ